MYTQTLPTRYANGDVLESFLQQRFGYGQYSVMMVNNSWTLTVPQALTAVSIHNCRRLCVFRAWLTMGTQGEISSLKQQMKVHYR
ncbi:hypothetical protein FDECE_386 [Fusarium decemcellulare]|nr:hypothetical protein FDECE_386 [Fusarium decemcellulare]